MSYECTVVFLFVATSINFFQVIQTISTGIDQQRLLELLLYGSSYYGLNINVKIFEAIHTFIAATKRFV